MHNIRVYREGKLTDIQILRRSSLNTYVGPDMAPGWDDVVIVDNGVHYKPATRYQAPGSGRFYYHCSYVFDNDKDPLIEMQEALIG